MPHSVICSGEVNKDCTKFVLLLYGHLHVTDEPDNLVGGGITFPESSLTDMGKKADWTVTLAISFFSF